MLVKKNVAKLELQPIVGVKKFSAQSFIPVWYDRSRQLVLNFADWVLIVFEPTQVANCGLLESDRLNQKLVQV